MKTRILLVVFCLAFTVAGVAAETVVYYSAETVRDHFEIAGKLDSKKAGLYKKLQLTFGIKDRYSSDEIIAIEFPKVNRPNPKRQPIRTGEKLPDAFWPHEVENFFEVKKGSKDGAKANMAILEQKYGRQPWYIAPEIRDVLANGDAPLQIPTVRNDTDLVAAAKEEVAEGKVSVPHTLNLPPILIRKDWTDVLLDEDPSQEGIESKSIGDLVGAAFSYSTERVGGVETWNTIGSLIVPWLHVENEVYAGVKADYYGLTPSVSLNRLSTNGKGNPKNEVDQLFYRVGVFAEWYRILPWVEYMQLRGAGVYGTDTGHRARMPGFELDLEPVLIMGQRDGKEVGYKLGARNTLWRKAQLLDDGSDQSLLDYQLRLWLHLEGGDIQNISKTWTATPDEFLRLGPTAQLRINMPQLWRGFSISAQYSNLETLQGQRGNNSLFKLDATLNLVSDKSTGRKISLNAGYTNGGLNFTKQDVDLVTLGMSLLY